MKCFRLLALLTVAALPVAGLTGCNSAPAIRSNMTNAADSTTRSTPEDYNDYARVVDHNTRMIWDDIARIMMLDRTSRLSPWVAP